MTRLLRLDTSARNDGSHTRELADDLERRWRVANPEGEVIVRDLAANPVPHLDQATRASFLDSSAPPTDQTTLSRELVDELKSADEVLVSAPMHNFSVPSVLKAWIDHIVRYGLTINVSDKGAYEGLLSTRCVWVVTASGALHAEGPMTDFDHLSPYLETLFRFLGVQDVKHVRVEVTDTTPEALAAGRTQAELQLQKLLDET